MLSLFLDYVNSTKALRLKLDMQNYQLLKAMQAFIGSVTILTHQKFEEAYVSIMLASMKYALDEVENSGVPKYLFKAFVISGQKHIQVVFNKPSKVFLPNRIS